MYLLITLRKEFKKPRQIGNTHFDYGESWRNVCHNSHITMTSTMKLSKEEKKQSYGGTEEEIMVFEEKKKEMKRQAERNKEKYT